MGCEAIWRPLSYEDHWPIEHASSHRTSIFLHISKLLRGYIQIFLSLVSILCWDVQPCIYLVTCTYIFTHLSRSHTQTILLLTVTLFVLASTSTGYGPWTLPLNPKFDLTGPWLDLTRPRLELTQPDWTWLDPPPHLTSTWLDPDLTWPDLTWLDPNWTWPNWTWPDPDLTDLTWPNPNPTWPQLDGVNMTWPQLDGLNLTRPRPDSTWPDPDLTPRPDPTLSQFNLTLTDFYFEPTLTLSLNLLLKIAKTWHRPQCGTMMLGGSEPTSLRNWRAYWTMDTILGMMMNQWLGRVPKGVPKF